ncbi:MAG: shikimate dehydrogenase [Gammaproteobacteria bacterium]
MKNKQPTQFAVVGNPIQHSLSPIIHQYFAKQAGISLSYEKLEPSTEEPIFERTINTFFEQNGTGLNITLPFKKRAFALAKHTTSQAQATQTANTLWVQDNQIWADSTDGVGLIRSLANLTGSLENKRILLIGAGGAARSIIPALLEQKPELLVIANRTMAHAQTLSETFNALLSERIIATSSPKLVSQHYHLAINATSYGRKNDDPLPSQLLEAVEWSDLCYDLNYNQNLEPTAFCAAADLKGKQHSDGLNMLVQQAALSFSIWHQFQPDAEQVILRLRSELSSHNP